MNGVTPVEQQITAAEYDDLYAHRNGWEFWYGHARLKPMPTESHGILQALLAYILKLAGYRASTETELRIAPEWYPRPDVCGIRGKTIERHPTQPIDVVFEVLSEDEDAVVKCREYARIGIRQVFILMERNERFTSGIEKAWLQSRMCGWRMVLLSSARRSGASLSTT